MKRFPPVLLWLPVAMLVGAPAGARAGDAAAAQALFSEAKRQMAAGNYAAACPKLEESQRQDAAIGTQLNLADCYEKVGRTASAWALFLEVAAAAKGQPAREKVARERAAALEPRLTRLTVVVTSPAGAIDVKRDGVIIGRGEWGTAIPVDPGVHVVAASAEGAKPWQSSVNAQDEGKTLTVAVPELEAKSAPVVAPTTATPPTPPPEDHAVPAEQSDKGRGPGAAVLLLGGIGVAGVAVGASFGFWSLVKHNDASGHCVGDSCDAVGVASRDDAIHAGNASTIAFGVGFAALAGAGVLWLTSAPNKSTGNLHAAPVVGTRGGGITLGGGF